MKRFSDPVDTTAWGEGGLDALEGRVRDDLGRIAHPKMAWLEPHIGPDGAPALDVLIVGAGQSGVAAAFGLSRAKVDNVLVVDKASRGHEGPWRTYARMPTLRSPKDYTGPDLDIPSLTYQSWHEARYGVASFAELPLITREDWAAYLLWVRDVTGVKVANETALTDIAPAGPLLAVTLRSNDGASRVVHARKILLATGQDGTGLWWMPDVIAALPADVRAHAADPIDFEALRDKTVAVIGAGASAFDNAATALEHGAKHVMLLCRRQRLQVIQPYRWLTFRGFLSHLGDLDDAWRWRFMSRVLGLREGFPQPTFDRCARHANFSISLGTAIHGAAFTDDRGVVLDTGVGRIAADFVICGTGIDMDFASKPELARFAGNIATWSDRYEPPSHERDERLGRFPYLAPDFSFVEKQGGVTPWLRNIHLFSIASTMSFGPSGSSINAMTTVVPKVVAGLTSGLFREDVERHWTALDSYDVVQADISDAHPAFRNALPERKPA